MDICAVTLVMPLSRSHRRVLDRAAPSSSHESAGDREQPADKAHTRRLLTGALDGHDEADAVRCSVRERLAGVLTSERVPVAIVRIRPQLHDTPLEGSHLMR